MIWCSFALLKDSQTFQLLQALSAMYCTLSFQDRDCASIKVVRIIFLTLAHELNRSDLNGRRLAVGLRLIVILNCILINSLGIRDKYLNCI